MIRNLEVIGQALKDFGMADLNEIVPEMPWRQISGMRNFLPHEYLGVDMVMIWDTLYFDDHYPPHFHAEYQGREAFSISEGKLLEGDLPRKTISIISDWARRLSRNALHFPWGAI